MYCPGCSTQATEGAKFCKSCGMNLSVITQALSGGVLVSDPLRDREFKRARKQVSDGIQGLAIGTAVIVAGAVAYIFIPRETWVYVVSLTLALFGIVKLFRSIGAIVDARVGPKLLDPALQPRATGSLSNSGPINVRPSQRLGEAAPKPISQTRPVQMAPPADKAAADTQQPPADPALRTGTGRINREHSTQLRKLDKEEDLMSLLRN